MSTGPLRLALPVAADLATPVAADLAPVCERIEIVGSIRRRRADVGDIEIVAIPGFSRGMFGGPGASLLDLALVQMVNRGRLLRASKTPLERLTCKPFYIPSLLREGHYFKLEINVSDAERWPVELAIKTGSANFSHRLVTPRNRLIAPGVYGLLPSHWRIMDGWQVWEYPGGGAERRRVLFDSEREFIEAVCGEWVEPERRD